MAEQMAEYVCHAVLRRYREFDVYAEQQQRRRCGARGRGRASGDFAIGILGLGLLGSAVARRAAAVRIPASRLEPQRKRVAGVATFAGRGELDGFLALAQVLVCLLPLTPRNAGPARPGRPCRGCRAAHTVVNVSRGAIVVDDDLLALLDSGHLARAMLDVFGDEPLPPGHRFWHHPRVALTPHVAAITQIEESVAQIAEKILRLEAGACGQRHRRP